VSAVVLGGCGTAASTPSASVAPSATETASPAPTPEPTDVPSPAPTPISGDVILSGTPEVVSLATLTADLTKSLQDSSFLATTFIPPQAIGRLESCSTVRPPGPLLEDSPYRQSYSNCAWLIRFFYAAYRQSFFRGGQTGTDLLYQVSKDAYAYALQPDGPYDGIAGQNYPAHTKAELDDFLRPLLLQWTTPLH
jgi:hypothetical protein